MTRRQRTGSGAASPRAPRPATARGRTGRRPRTVRPRHTRGTKGRRLLEPGRRGREPQAVAAHRSRLASGRPHPALRRGGATARDRCPGRSCSGVVHHPATMTGRSPVNAVALRASCAPTAASTPTCCCGQPDKLLDEIFPYSAPWHLGRAQMLLKPPTHVPRAPHRPGYRRATPARPRRSPARSDLRGSGAGRVVAPARSGRPARPLLPPRLAATVDRAIRYWSGASQSRLLRCRRGLRGRPGRDARATRHAAEAAAAQQHPQLVSPGTPRNPAVSAQRSGVPLTARDRPHPGPEV